MTRVRVAPVMAAKQVGPLRASGKAGIAPPCPGWAARRLVMMAARQLHTAATATTRGPGEEILGKAGAGRTDGSDDWRRCMVLAEAAKSECTTPL